MTNKTTAVRETTDIISVDNLKDAIAKNNFVDLDEALIKSIHEQTDNVLEKHSITEQTAKEIIDKWHKKNLLGTKTFDITALQLTVTNQPTIYIQSQYHCETRQFNRDCEPYRNQVIAKTAEELWERPAQNAFTESSFKRQRAGNNEIKKCHNCSATGKETCNECKGNGEISVKCPNCKGKGIIRNADVVVGRGGGKNAAGAIFKDEQCIRCRATGVLQATCPKCNGKGELTCSLCAGYKQLFYYDNIEGKTSVISKELILSTFSSIKDKWIKNNKSEFQINYKDIIQKQNEDRLKNEIPPSGKLLLEKYSIKVLPTAQIKFNFNGKDRELFIIENH
ncbi:MAG: hypothetical protein AABZ32_02780 [Bacteroidota bacterium]